MEFVRAIFMIWKREQSTHKYTRIDGFSELLFDAVYENNFELAKMLIDDGNVSSLLTRVYPSSTCIVIQEMQS